MTDKKLDQDEKLIEELYTKLWWYTYEATDEEFNAQEVDAIVQLLEVMEPIKDDNTYEPGAEAAFQRFQDRYSMELEHMEDIEEEPEGEEDGKASKVSLSEVSAPKERACKRKNEKAGKEAKHKKRLLRLATAAAACTVLVVSLNVGTFALQRKSFFEVIVERIGKTKVIVTGNEEIEENTSGEITCESWEEVEEILGEEILQVNYIPDGYVLTEMTVGLMEGKDKVFAKYCNDEDKYFVIKVYIYPENYSINIVSFDEEWELIKEEKEGKKIQYYSKDDIIEAFFVYGKATYYITNNENLETLEKVVNAMK